MKFAQAGMVVHTCHPSTLEVEEARESGVHGSLQQHSEFGSAWLDAALCRESKPIVGAVLLKMDALNLLDPLRT